MVKIGIVLFDHYTAQTWSAVTMLTKFFSEHPNIKRVVELGTGCGGLTLLFGVNMLQRNGKVLSFDVEPIQSEKAKRDFKKLNITFEHKDVFKLNTIIQVKEFIAGEQALIFCDNGDKSREFPLYMTLLKNGDFIMAHDWGTEITQHHLNKNRDAMSVHMEPYLQEEFDAAETYILSMRRK